MYINDNGKHTLLIYGAIGYEINGHQFAQNLQNIKNADEIVVRINSSGGSVEHGYSIFSALLDHEAKIKVIIDGIAGSMAGVIAQAGDVIEMKDFAKYMVHDPRPANKATIDENTQKAIDAIKDSLATILTRRGINKKEMNDIMSAETWLSARDCKEKGLIDRIISTKQQKNISPVMAQAVAAINMDKKNLNNSTNSEKMEALFNKLNLNKEASEQSAINAVDEMDNAINTLKNENETLEKTNKELENKIEALEKEKKEAQKKAIENKVDKLIEKGFINRKKRDIMVNEATKSPMTFDAFYDSFSQDEKGNLANMVNGFGGKPNETKNAADSIDGATDAEKYETLMQNSVQLSEFKAANPKEFERLQNAWQDA
jgi:ATP-dependent protease ClpP protease subunit